MVWNKNSLEAFYNNLRTSTDRMYHSNKTKDSLDVSEMPHISQLQASHLGPAGPRRRGEGGGGRSTRCQIPSENKHVCSYQGGAPDPSEGMLLIRHLQH